MQIGNANTHRKETMYLSHACLIIIMSCRESNKLPKESFQEQTQKSFGVAAESLDCIKCDLLGRSAKCMQCKSKFNSSPFSGVAGRAAPQCLASAWGEG